MSESNPSADSSSGAVLERLAAVIEARKSADPESSYVASLVSGEEARRLKKVGEEAVEFAVAVCGGDRAGMVSEAADLWFHVMVALAARGVDPVDVVRELGRRFGTSGIEEKAARGR